MKHSSGDVVQQLMAIEPKAVMAGLRSGQISRRDIGKLFAALGLTAVLGPRLGPSPRARPVERADDDHLGGVQLRFVPYPVGRGQ